MYEYEDENEYIIDLSGVSGREELHERLAESLPLPDHYGANLDALYDTVTEIGDGWHIIFTGVDDLDEDMRDYAEEMFDVFRDASAVLDDLTITVEGEEDEEEDL